MHQEIRIEKYGSVEGLRLRTATEDLVPGPGEVVVAVRYSGINFADIQMRLGFYPDAPRRPFVPGYEISGVVEAVGPGVTGLRPGDEVLAGTYFGGYASKVKLPRHQVFKVPPRLGLEGAAAMPVNYFTAELALVEMGRVRAGDRVLIECATGGVGVIAMQMARQLGAEVVGLTSSPAKKAFIAEYGATPYTVDEFEADPAIGGFDFVLNASGGRSIRRQLMRTQFTGRIVCMGLNSGIAEGRRNPLRLLKAAVETPIFPVFSLMDKNRGVYGLNALRVLEDPAWIGKLTARLEADLSRLDLRPHVDRVFAATDAGAAHEFLQAKKAKGKVLLGWS